MKGKSRGRSLKAFTILELVIAMMISAIVIAIAYTGLKMVLRSFHAFSKRYEQTMVMLKLNELLTKDIDRSEAVRSGDEGISMTGSGQSVHYRFEGDELIRTAVKSDTFRIKASDVRMAFEGVPIGETSFSNLIDDLYFTSSVGMRKVPHHFHKRYSSEQLYKR